MEKHPRWRVAITADDFSKQLLLGPMEVDLVEDPTAPCDLYLAHDELDASDNPDHVRRLGRDLVSDLRSAVGLNHPHNVAITFRDIVRPVNEDGTLGPRAIHMQVEEGVYVMIAHAVGSTARRHPSVRALELMQSDASFREATRLFAECGEDYAQLYVIFEHVCDAAMLKRTKKPNTNGVVAQKWADRSDIERFVEVANAEHRHRRRKTDKAMSPREARSFVGALLGVWVNKKQPR